MRIYKTGYVLSRSEENQMAQKLRVMAGMVLKTKTPDDLQRQGAVYYEFIGEPNACHTCTELHGIAFPLSRASEGKNLPPIHPNCKCDIVAYTLPVFSFGNANDNPGGVAPNEWIFFGRDGDEFNYEPDEIYTDDYFGKTISKGDYNQNDIEMHIVNRIARILFHETSDAKGQEAIAWLMINRMLKEGDQYTTNWNDELTLFNIVTAREQYEIFQEQHNRSSKQPSAYAPVEWIAGIENATVKKEQEQSWKNSLRLAKLLVTAACNPDLDTPDKIRGVFESWVSNPFNCENPYDVWEYRSYPVSGATWRQNIGGNILYQK